MSNGLQEYRGSLIKNLDVPDDPDDPCPGFLLSERTPGVSLVIFLEDSIICSSCIRIAIFAWEGRCWLWGFLQTIKNYDIAQKSCPGKFTIKISKIAQGKAWACCWWVFDRVSNKKNGGRASTQMINCPPPLTTSTTTHTNAKMPKKSE